MDTLQLGDGHFTIGGTDTLQLGERTLYMGEGDGHYTREGTDNKGVVPPFLRICASFFILFDNI